MFKVNWCKKIEAKKKVKVEDLDDLSLDKLDTLIKKHSKKVKISKRIANRFKSIKRKLTLRKRKHAEFASMGKRWKKLRFAVKLGAKLKATAK